VDRPVDKHLIQDGFYIKGTIVPWNTKQSWDIESLMEYREKSFGGVIVDISIAGTIKAT
jgi:hypothetical protein